MHSATRGLRHLLLVATQDRMSLRQTCKTLFDSVSFGGIRLAYPMAPSERQLIPALAKRSVYLGGPPIQACAHSSWLFPQPATGVAPHP